MWKIDLSRWFLQLPVDPADYDKLDSCGEETSFGLSRMYGAYGMRVMLDSE